MARDVHSALSIPVWLPRQPFARWVANLISGDSTGVVAAGLVLFAATFIYFLVSATDLTNDHFMHVAWGRQVLKGRLFVRDMAVLGMPLQSALSAAAEWLIGYRLLATAAVFSLAFAAGAVLVFMLARRASGSIWIGVIAAVLQVVPAPRSYSYPKIIVYAAGIALLWRYLDHPSRRRAAAVGLAIGIAFYLRHDHGAYLGIVAVAVMMLRHWRDWRLAARRLLLVSAISVGAIAPYLIYIQVHWGVGSYLTDLRALANREYHQNRFEHWPAWPLASLDDVVRWSPRDTVGSLHLLPGLDTGAESAAFLFYLVAGSVVISLLILSSRRSIGNSLGAWGRIKVATVILVAVVTAVGFIREPLAARIADALVAPLILVAWWTGLVIAAGTRRTVGVVIAQVAVIALLATTARSATVLGGLSPFIRKAADWPVTSRQLLASPPFDGWTAGGSALYRAVQYVRACTAPDEPLLVLWFAPDLYYYADRPFAGRLGFYLEGYWSSPLHERLNLAAIERDRPTIAIIEAGREETDLYTYPELLEYVARHYQTIGTLTRRSGTVLRVLARADRAPTSIDSALGWPCYT